MQKEVPALTDRPAPAEPDREVRGVRDSRSLPSMSLRGVCLAALLAATALAAPALAQEVDPIGALLDKAAQTPGAPAATTPAATPPAGPAPDAAAPLATAPQAPATYAPTVQTPAPAPAYAAPQVATAPPPAATYAPVPPAGPSAGPQPYSAPPPISYARPPRPQLSAPVHIDEVGKTPDGPPTPTDLNYEARMRASFASAQGMQGALDGHWIIRSVLGAELYDLQLVDKNNGVLEGAWRDPRRRGAADSSGFLDDVQRNGGQIIARFQIRASGERAVLTLNAESDGDWSGDLSEQGDRRGVSMKRN